MNITNQTTVAITGASSGIGAALALRLADYGGNLAICARRQSRLLSVAEEARSKGARVHISVTDVTGKSEAEKFVKTCIENFGGIDVLVNNAGRGNCASVEDTSEQQLQSIFAVNVFPLWYTSAIALALMKARNRGHIINISSMAGKIGYPFNSAYVAAKHAVVGFTAALRCELMGTGVHASVICPSAVDTEWADVTEGSPIGDLFSKGIKNSRSVARMRAIPLAPLKPLVSAQRIADIIVDSILNPPAGDVFTHAGTLEQAVLCAEDRGSFENQMLPLYIGMQQAYLSRERSGEK